MHRRFATSLRHLLLAFLVGSLATVVRAAAQPILGDAVPFLVAFPAIALAALLWGAVPGVAAALVCALAVLLPGIPPAIPNADLPVQMGGFFLAAGVISILCGQLRGSNRFVSAASTDVPSETPLSVWLKAVLWGALVVPLCAFVAISWWSLERAKSAAEANLAQASELAFRQADHVFATAEEIASRADRASNLPDDQIRVRELEIHQRLADMTAGLSAVHSVNVWDADGLPLARSDTYPAKKSLPISDRPHFQERRTSTAAIGVSEAIVGRHLGKEMISVTRRRSSADGAFRGILTVTLAPAYFREYYRSLASDEPTLATFMLVRSDGSVLVRWPAQKGAAPLLGDSRLIKLMAEGVQEGRFVFPEQGSETHLVAVKRITNAPVYVITGLSRSAMLSNWARFVGLLAAILIPITAGLVYVTWVALNKTRREQAVSAKLQEEILARGIAQRKMLESQKLETLAAVTGGVAHDFNNLLAIVSSSVHVHKMLHPALAEDKQIGAISRAVQSGVRLTRQLLSFSQKQALRPEVISLQAWLPFADGLMRSTLGSGAHWSSTVEADTRPVKVDVHELELALINLVLNAKRAMPDGGRLRVHVSNDADAAPGSPMVIICVIDTGEGIAPEILPKVFEPFFTTRQKGVGSGLGLSQVQGFCKQAGGRASIQSTVGEGTTVCMHLPAATEVAVTEFASEATGVGRLEARLLLVEDNEEVGSTAEQMLSSSGLTVTRVVSADAAIAQLADARATFDVVLSDISMPGSMNGIGLAQEIGRRYPDLPVMLMTGYAEQMSEGMAQGMRVFQKPVAPDELLTELRALVHAA